MSVAKKYLNTEEAARYIGMSRQYLEIGRHKGYGPPYTKLPLAVRYNVDDLDTWMRERVRKHTSEGAA